MSIIDEFVDVIVNIPRWRDQAACLGMDTEIFFPERGEVTDKAKEICSSCPVQADCLEYAIDKVIRVGVWGGTSERWRRRERHQRARERIGLDRLADIVIDQPPEWLAPEYAGLWRRRRAPRRGTFGCGCNRCKAVARQLADSAS